ncbi:transcription factor Tfb4-domain-containing protein [Apiosordaria backusii]|uniref:General transcription and DNA repair factor IIH subunit TFB4 n=1 Tax=Apiosordaria backusii TaxID=314023 RepID=A0AA40EY56_9PEZI|nr:transcription factor Tfb4-domain-containing protein [Apiosordaria backusii]
MSAQDAVDASEHYEVYKADDVPSLTTIIIDTNPRAWAALGEALPLSKAIANILIFVNSHLAFSNSNQVAIIAAHTNRAIWLYPTPPKPPSEDVEMRDAGSKTDGFLNSANKYPQYAQIEHSLLTSLRGLIGSTIVPDLDETTTQISGALTLALAHISKTALSYTASQAPSNPTTGTTAPGATTATTGGLAGFHARILVLSVSDSAASQYIPTMNAVFAAAMSRIAIDTLALRGNATFLEQASFITRGTFIRAAEPQGLLQYLMFGFGVGSAPSNTYSADDNDAKALLGKPKATKKREGDELKKPVAECLFTPAADSVDFRAACFCHRNVVDTGFVCSICLSIFCEPPPDAECLTCGNKLALGDYNLIKIPPGLNLEPGIVGLAPSPSAKRKRTANGE